MAGGQCAHCVREGLAGERRVCWQEVLQHSCRVCARERERVHCDHPLLLPCSLQPPAAAAAAAVEMDAGAGSNEDDVTMKLMQIVEVNNVLRQVSFNKGRGVRTV